MAKNWDDIASSDEFKKLSSEDQEATREYYFLKKIVPNTATADLARAREDFDSETAPTLTNKVKKQGKKILGELTGTVADIAKGGLINEDGSNALRSLTGGSVMDDHQPQPDPRAMQAATNGVAPVSALGQAKLQELATVDPQGASQLAAREGVIGDAARAEVAARAQELDARAAGLRPQLNPTEQVAGAIEGAKSDEALALASESGLGREVRYQTDNFKVGVNQLLNAMDGMKMQDLAGMNLPGAREAEAEMAAKIQERNAENEMLRQRGRDSTKAFFDADKGQDTWGTLKNMGQALIDGNVGLLADLTVQSGVPSAVSLAAAAVFSRVGGLNAGAAAGGAGSAFIDFGNGYAQRRAQGESHEEATKNAAIKAGIVGLFDAVSFKTAGDALANIINAGASKIGHTAKEVAKETLRQGALGGGGEAWGSFAVGEMPSLPEVGAEILGEMGTGPFEAASTYQNTQTKPEVIARAFKDMVDNARWAQPIDTSGYQRPDVSGPAAGIDWGKPSEPKPLPRGDGKVEPTAKSAPKTDTPAHDPNAPIPAEQLFGKEEGEEAAPTAETPAAPNNTPSAGSTTPGYTTPGTVTNVSAGPAFGIDSVRQKGGDPSGRQEVQGTGEETAPEVTTPTGGTATGGASETPTALSGYSDEDVKKYVANPDSKFFAQQQDNGKWRAVSRANLNPVSPGFATEREAIEWAINEDKQQPSTPTGETTSEPQAPQTEQGTPSEPTPPAVDGPAAEPTGGTPTGGTATGGAAPAGEGVAQGGGVTETPPTTGTPAEPAAPKTPKAEVTTDTPVSTKQAKSRWAAFGKAELDDAGKADHETEDWQVLGGVPHVVSKSGKATHFYRNPENPKVVLHKAGFASPEAEAEYNAAQEKANGDPIKAAIDAGDSVALRDHLFESHPKLALDPPMILPNDNMVQFVVPNGQLADLNEVLKKSGFRVTDRSSEAGDTNTTVTALYRPKKSDLGAAGEELHYNRKQNNPPKLEKDATDGQIDKLLASLAVYELIDPNSNPDNTFGVMMFKEGLAEYLTPASAYISAQLKRKAYFSERMGARQIIKSALEAGMADTVNELAEKYRNRLTTLQGVLHQYANVSPLGDALRAFYFTDGQLNDHGRGLQFLLKKEHRHLEDTISILESLFQDENSTDQSKRIKKHDADAAPAVKIDMIVRRGMKDHRQGKDVDEADFLNTFGFIGLDFGNWVNQTERQGNLNLVYDSLMDMADLTGIDPKLLGLNEKLKLAIGAQGRGGKTAAWYVPGLNEINLTKTKGDGTVAHEWHHGLDANIRASGGVYGKVLMDDLVWSLRHKTQPELLDSMLRSLLRDTADSTSNRNVPPKEAAFNAILGERWYVGEVWRHSGAGRSTTFFQDAKLLDEGASEPYYAKPTEMLSRGFESYLYDLSKGGSPYLVGPSRANNAMSPKTGYAGRPYPADAERQHVADAFKQAMSQIDPVTLSVKTYTPDYTIQHIEGLGWYAIDQNGLGTGQGTEDLKYALKFFDTKEKAEHEASPNVAGNERVLTPKAVAFKTINATVLHFANNVDAIMEEMGIFKWPEIKNGSMAESMFYHMRQGWWPKNNKELEDYVVKAYQLGKGEHGEDARNAQKLDLVKLKQGQEDFEAAAARFLGQRITDMRNTGADDRAIYDKMVELYQSMPTLNVRTATSMSNQAYSTPFPIAFLAGQLARVSNNDVVLEPTAGNGILAFTANPKNVLAIELEQRRANNLRLMETGKVMDGDALNVIDKNVRDQEADVVLTNPPFGALGSPVPVASWDGKNYQIGRLDQLIAAKALRGMADKGRAVLILGANKEEGRITTSDRVFLNWLYSNYNVADHFEIDGSLYRKMGAEWPLRVLVIAGRSQTDQMMPTGLKVERIGNFDSLWSRYVQASSNSEEVVVGAGRRQSGTGSSDQRPGGVPESGSGQDGNAGGERGTGAGDENSGDASGSDTGTGVGGASGKTGNGGRKGRGKDSDGGSGSSESGASGRGKDSGGAAGGTELGGDAGVSSGDISDWLNEGFNEPVTPPAKKTGGKTKSGTGSTGKRSSAPKGESTTPTSTGTVFDGVKGADDILARMRAKLNGGVTPTSGTPANKPTKPKTPETITKPLAATPVTETQKPAIPADYLKLLTRMGADAAAVRASVSKLAASQGEMGPPQRGKTSRYSRLDGTDDSVYAELKADLAELWEQVKGKFSDLKSAVIQFGRDLRQIFGNMVAPYANRFLNDILGKKDDRVPDGKKPVRAEMVDNANQIVYASRSHGESEGIFLPRSQAQALYTALDVIESNYGDVDDFVRQEMGYADNATMYKALGGYQIDALALALHNMKNGNGFIIGDDTGVGKGRTAAAAIAWAVKNGKVPIFFSVTDTLYSDMYRDLSDIGFGNIKIAMTNTNGEIRDGANKVIYKNKGKDGSKLTKHIIDNGTLPDGAQALFTAYSQVSNPKHSAQRMAAIRRLVQDGKAVLVMDEAHGAGGESNTNDFFMNLLTGATKDDPHPKENYAAPPVLYLSATFAKRPNNMPVYVRTSLRYAADTLGELVDMFKAGGDVLQQVASEMLVKAGSMIRRERSYAGVKMQYVIDEANAPRDARLVDEVTEVLRAVVRADRAFNDWVSDKNVQDMLIKKYAPGTDASTGKPMFDDIGKNPFTSIVHNYVSQLLLSTKIDQAVSNVVAAMNNGQKAVIALQSTMESPLQDYVDMNGLQPGDDLTNFGWQAILDRGLSTARRIRFKSATGEKKDDIVKLIPMDDIPPGVKAEFDKATALIQQFNSPLLVSPIDAIRQKLEGYEVWEENGQVRVGEKAPDGVTSRALKVAEITGRTRGVDYRHDVPKLYTRDDPGRVPTINGFQNEGGGIDVIILNSAGATGISLHSKENQAGKPAQDQRPRHMFILQPNPDIAVYKQMLGRIHRTGQVEWPEFTVMASGIPAERRMLAVLKAKLSTLVSNTSAGSSAVGVEATDFINRYGDIVTADYLMEHKEQRIFLGVQVPDDASQAEGTDISLTASGRAALLTVADQTEYFDSIEDAYKKEIAMRDAAGTNQLTKRWLNLEAEIEEEAVLEEGLNEVNPFTKSALLGKYQVNIIGDIPSAKGVQDAVEQSLNGRKAHEVVDAIVADLKVAYDEALNQIILQRSEVESDLNKPDLTEKEREELQVRQRAIEQRVSDFGTRRETTINALSRTYAIGTGYANVEYADVESAGVITAITYSKPKSKTGNPFSPANFTIHVQRNLPNGRMAIPLSRLESASSGIKMTQQYRTPDLADWFQMKDAVGGRKPRYIATNNLLRARIALQGQGGEIVNFTYKGHTDETPRIGVGIMLPAKYKPGNLGARDYRIRSSQTAVDFVMGAWAKALEERDQSLYGELIEKIRSHIKTPAEFDAAMVRQHSTRLLQGAGTGYLLELSSYRPASGFTLKVDAQTHKQLINTRTKAIKEFWENTMGVTLAKQKNTRYYETSGYINDPAKVAKLVRFIHENAESLTNNDFTETASAIAKANFEAEEGGNGLFSRKAAQGGSTVAKVEKWVSRAKAKFAKQGVAVSVVQSVSDLPDDAAPGDTEGVWISGTNRVYLVADNLGSRERAQKVLAHEAVGHALLEDMLGEALMGNLVKEVNALEAQGNMTIRALGKIVDMRQPDLDKDSRAREIVALMAERRMQHRIWRRIANAVRNFLRSLGFDIAFSDKDIDTLLQNAEKHVIGQRAFNETSDLAPAYSRKDPRIDELVAVLKSWSKDDALFKYPRVASASMQDIVDAFDSFDVKLVEHNAPVSRVYDNGVWERKVVHEYFEFKIKTTDPVTKKEVWRDATATVNRDLGVTEINVAELKSGDAGSVLYNIVGQWSHNNKLKFRGDQSGISNKAIYRRNENMISLALKLGSTEYMDIHPDMQKKWDGERKGEKFWWPGMEWYGKDFDKNLASMLMASYNLITRFEPRLRDVRFDYPTGQFVHRRTGQVVPESFFQSVAALQQGGARRAGAGSTTLARAVIAKSILEGEANVPARAGVSDGTSVQPAQSAIPVAARGRYYSRNRSARWFRTGGAKVAGRTEGGLFDKALQKVGGKLLAEKVTKPIYEKIKHVALERDFGGKIGEYVDTIRAGMVSDFGLDDEYLDAKTDMHVAINKHLRGAKEIVTKLQGLTRDESRVVYWWLNTSPEEAADREAELWSQLPEDSKQTLLEVKDRILQLGEQAVELGQLSKEAFDRNKMAYLHRDYAKHVFGEETAKQMGVLRANASRIIGEQYKGRGLFFDIDGGKLIADVSKLDSIVGTKYLRLEKKSANGKKVLKRVWVPADQDVPDAYADYEVDAAPWEVRKAKGGVATMWRDFTQEEREQMGELDEAKYGVAITIAQLAKDVETGRFFAWVAENYAVEKEDELPEGAKIVTAKDLDGQFSGGIGALEKDTWVKVPTTSITETGGTKKYGALAGKYVPGAVWNDLRQLRQKPLPFGQLYDKLLGLWKISKTALSPAVHMNNVMANWFMADMHDVQFTDVVKALDTIYRANKGDADAKKMMERFEDSGALGGTFVMSDLRTDLIKPLLDALRAEATGELSDLDLNVQLGMVLSLLKEKKLKQAMNALSMTKGAALAKKLPDILLKAYQEEDTIFRVAKFIQAVETGSSDREAGKASREAFLNYEINAPWVQTMRHSALPFVAFSYRMIPMAIDVAANKPWKIAKYAMLTNFLAFAAMTLGGVDDDEWRRIRKLLPEDKIGTTPFLTERQIPLGKDSHGRPLVLDISRWVPLGDVFELQGDQASNLPIWTPLYPSGPVMLAAEVFSNESFFTGKTLWQKTDTGPEAIAKASAHVWRSLMPNLIGLPGTYATNKVVDAVGGKTDVLGREYSVGTAVASGFGIKVSPQDVASLKRNAYYAYKDASQELNENIIKLGNQHARNGITRKEYDAKLKSEVEKIKKLNDDFSKKMRGD